MILANARQTCEGWSLDHRDSTVTSAPLFHTGGWNVLTLPLLLSGGTVTLAEKFDPELLAAQLAEGRATVWFGVPTMFQMLLERARPLLEEAAPRLRFLISGGAPCPRRLIDAYLALGVNFRQGFGMTEIGPNCFEFPPEAVRRKAGSVGLPMTGTRMKLIGDDGRPAEHGELCIAGEHLFSGYWNRPKRRRRPYMTAGCERAT